MREKIKNLWENRQSYILIPTEEKNDRRETILKERKKIYEIICGFSWLGIGLGIIFVLTTVVWLLSLWGVEEKNIILPILFVFLNTLFWAEKTFKFLSKKIFMSIFRPNQNLLTSSQKNEYARLIYNIHLYEKTHEDRGISRDLICALSEENLSWGFWMEIERLLNKYRSNNPFNPLDIKNVKGMIEGSHEKKFNTPISKTFDVNDEIATPNSSPFYENNDNNSDLITELKKTVMNIDDKDVDQQRHFETITKHRKDYL